MKKLLFTSLLFFTILLSGNLKAQTSITIDYSFGYNAGGCPLPQVEHCYVTGIATGYNDLVDSMSIHIYWGDGTDTIFMQDLFDGGLVDSFAVWSLNHNYYLPGTFSPMVIATGPDGNADTSFVNPLTYAGGCATIDGNIYIDNNANCLFDAGDDNISWCAIRIIDLTSGITIAWAYPDTLGHYSMDIPNGTGSVKIEPQYYTWIYDVTVCPVAGSYTFIPSSSMSFDFALDCSATSHELSVYSGGHVASPGGMGFGMVIAENIACDSVAGTFSFVLDSNVVYAGMIYGPPPTTILGNTLIWNHVFSGVLGSNHAILVKFYLQTLTTASVLDTACFNSSVGPIAGDLMPANNVLNWCTPIGGPYDPNNKEVMPIGIGATGNVLPETDFIYTINFQNTGTAPAINVFIMDTISSNLDMSTLQIFGSSHTMNPEITGTNIVRFDFPSINLIDSVANEPLSHGWVTYRIKAKPGLANSTQIKNTAHIYFDYNPAIITNTTLNTIDISLGLKEEVNASMSNVLFPNPATNMVTVQFENYVSGNLILVDVTGRQVKSMNVYKVKEIQFSLNDIPAGFYGIVLPGVALKQNRLQVIK